MLVLFSCGLFLNLPNAQKKISLFQNPSGIGHHVLPKNEKMTRIETKDLIKVRNEKNQPEQEEDAPKTNKKSKNQKRTREDESLEGAKRPCIEPEIACSEMNDNQSSVEICSQASECSQDSIVTVIFPPTDIMSSPEEPGLCQNVEFRLFPLYISDQEGPNSTLLKELEID